MSNSIFGIPGTVITSTEIVDGSIVAADIADGAITSAKILDGTIVAGDIAAATITGAKIAAGTIDETNLDVSTNASLDLADTAIQVETPGFRNMVVTGQVTVSADNASDNLQFVAGTNVTLTTNNTSKQITITAAAAAAANTFGTIAVSGQANVVADSTTDTLTLASGSGIALTTDATTDTVNIAVADGTRGDITVSSTGAVWTVGSNFVKRDVATTYDAQHNFAATEITSSAGTLNWFLNSQSVFHTLTANTTLANPTQDVNGGKYVFKCIQNATTPYTLTFGTDYKWKGGITPTVTTTLGGVDVFVFESDGVNMYGTHMYDLVDKDIAVADGGTGLSTLTANNVILGNGTSTPLFVAPSTSGNILTSNGTTWTSAAAAASAAPAVLLSTQTASNSASINFNSSLITTTYKDYYVEFQDILPSTADVNLTFRVSEDNGTTMKTTAGDYYTAVEGLTSAGTALSVSGQAFTSAFMTGSLSNDASSGLGGTLDIFNPAGTTSVKKFRAALVYQTLTGTNNTVVATGGLTYRSSINAINYISFLFNSGNIASGTFKLWGVA